MGQLLSKKSIGTVSVGIIVIAIIGALFFFDPTSVVEWLGARNGYVLLAVVAFFSGFSPIGYASFITILLALSLGGLNPLVIVLISGVCLSMGDTVIFLLVSQGRNLIKGRWEKALNTLAEKFAESTLLRRLTPFFAYLYVAFTPLPNDFLMLLLAAIKYPPRYAVPILVAGDITFSFLLVSVTQGVSFLFLM